LQGAWTNAARNVARGVQPFPEAFGAGAGIDRSRQRQDSDELRCTTEALISPQVICTIFSIGARIGPSIRSPAPIYGRASLVLNWARP
jgi:hypothetical protein